MWLNIRLIKKIIQTTHIHTHNKAFIFPYYLIWIDNFSLTIHGFSLSLFHLSLYDVNLIKKIVISESLIKLLLNEFRLNNEGRWIKKDRENIRIWIKLNERVGIVISITYETTIVVIWKTKKTFRYYLMMTTIAIKWNDKL